MAMLMYRNVTYILRPNVFPWTVLPYMCSKPFQKTGSSIVVEGVVIGSVICPDTPVLPDVWEIDGDWEAKNGTSKLLG